MKPSTSISKIPRALLWIGAILGGLIFLSVAAFGVMTVHMGNVPSDLDTSTTRLSDNGFYRVSYIASPGIIPTNQMHLWQLHVETLDGKPVEDATITVDGGMPQHGHGLPTRPRVTEDLGNGDYRVEGLKFQMGGWWVMDFVITAQGQSDTVQFNLMLR